MNMAEAARFRALEATVAQLVADVDELRTRLGGKNELSEVKMRLGSLQGQINSLRRPLDAVSHQTLGEASA